MFDSRKESPDSIFFAMKGKINDGHAFIGKAIANGAICIVHSDPVDREDGIVYIQTEDVTSAYVTFCKAFYDNAIDRMNVVGITGTNARPSIAPTFGVENMMGTNPLTFALPTDEEFPFCIDCATSVVQRGKIEFYARQGMDTPSGTVISNDGSYMTDSQEILKALVDGTAALAPLGGAGDEMAGYKGYGYAAVVEILSAALAGGQFMKALTGRTPEGGRQMYHLGHFFFVVDPDAFMGREEFRKTAGDICRALRASKKAPGHDRIYTAGEKEYLAWLDRKDKGVPLNASEMSDLTAVRDKLGLDYKFPWE